MNTRHDPETLPWSNEAEQSVLGGLLLDNAAFDRAGDLIDSRHFFDARHAAIWTAISALVLASKPADIVTVHEQLGDKVESVGGMAYLNALSQSVPSASNVHRYAEIVREKAAQRALLETADKALAIAAEASPVAEKLERIASAFARLTRATVRQVPRQFGEILMQRADRYSALAAGEEESGWPTRIPSLDRLLSGGMKPGNVYVLAARPKVGKSSLALALALTFAEQDLPVLVLSQEMPVGEVADRAIADLGGIDYGHLQTGKLDDMEWASLTAAVDRGVRLPIHVDDQPSLTMADIKAKARSIKGLKVLVVDYLQLCATTDDRQNRNAQIEEISRGLKGLAKDIGAAVIELSQLNRAVETRQTKRPNLSDLRDSGAIEQDADVVMFLWPVREFPDRRIVGLEVAANRQGKTGAFGLDFNGALQRWGESTASIQPPTRTELRGGFE